MGSCNIYANMAILLLYLITSPQSDVEFRSTSSGVSRGLSVNPISEELQVSSLTSLAVGFQDGPKELHP